MGTAVIENAGDAIYTELKVQNDIDFFLKEVCEFHDSYIHTVTYNSGMERYGRSTRDETMQHGNWNGASFVFYGQCKPFEIVFFEISEMHIKSDWESYGDWIYDANMFFEDGEIHWAIDEHVDSKAKFCASYISAKSAKWRYIPVPSITA
jgi:hypothetical protein